MRASASYPSTCRILRGARARPPSHQQPCGTGRSQGLGWLPTPEVEHVGVEVLVPRAHREPQGHQLPPWRTRRLLPAPP